MGISLAHQTQTFLISCMIGAGFGLLYDMIRITRMAASPPGWLISLEDLLFFFVGGLLTFWFMLSNNMGEVRFFVLLGELLGFIFYRCAFSPGIMGLGKDFLRIVKKLISFFYKVFFRPFYKLLRGILQFLLKPVHFVLKLAKKVTIKVKIGLKRQRIMLYNLCNVNVKNKDKNKARLKKPLVRIGRCLNGNQKTGKDGFFCKSAGGCGRRLCGSTAGQSPNKNWRKKSGTGRPSAKGEGTDSCQ